jgi:hypothetical protein
VLVSLGGVAIALWQNVVQCKYPGTWPAPTPAPSRFGCNSTSHFCEPMAGGGFSASNIIACEKVCTLPPTPAPPTLKFSCNPRTHQCAISATGNFTDLTSCNTSCSTDHDLGKGFHIESVGPCGDTAGTCLTMTPVDENPKGSYLSVTPCDDGNDDLQRWTFDPKSGHICSAKATKICIHFQDSVVYTGQSSIVRASDKITPVAWTYNRSTLALCSSLGAVDVVMDNAGGTGNTVWGNAESGDLPGTCNSPNNCEQWKFI